MTKLFLHHSAVIYIYTLSLHDALPICFTYRANDGTTNGNLVTVSITITPVNDAPVAVADSYTVAEGGTINKAAPGDRKSTRLNSSHPSISYAVFCLKKKKSTNELNKLN